MMTAAEFGSDRRNDVHAVEQRDRVRAAVVEGHRQAIRPHGERTDQRRHERACFARQQRRLREVGGIAVDGAVVHGGLLLILGTRASLGTMEDDQSVHKLRRDVRTEIAAFHWMWNVSLSWMNDRSGLTPAGSNCSVYAMERLLWEFPYPIAARSRLTAPGVIGPTSTNTVRWSRCNCRGTSCATDTDSWSEEHSGRFTLKRSPNWMASCAMTPCHALGGRARSAVM